MGLIFTRCQTLAEDAAAVWQALCGDELPPTVFVGHSMGGAVAVHASKSRYCLALSLLLVGSKPKLNLCSGIFFANGG